MNEEMMKKRRWKYENGLMRDDEMEEGETDSYGTASNEGYEPELKVPGDSDMLDQVLDEVICLTEDPDAEHEFIKKPTTENAETQTDEMPTADRIAEVEAEPAPEAHDEIEALADDIRRKEDADKVGFYGMQRRRPR